MSQDPRPIHTVFVCAASRMCARESYARDAHEMGTLLGENGYDLVYGGGEVGLMGLAAHAAHDAGANVIHSINMKIWIGSASQKFNRMVNQFLDTIFDRKKEMLRLSQAGIILVGGIGTADELFELMVNNDVIRFSPDHEKTPLRPVILVNTDGYYDHLIAWIQHSIKEGATPADRLDYLRVVNTPLEAMACLGEFNQSMRTPAPLKVKAQVYAAAK